MPAIYYHLNGCQCGAASIHRAARILNECPFTLITPKITCPSNGLFPTLYKVVLLFLLDVLIEIASDKCKDLKIIFIMKL
jgi:hypothetical protein